MDDKTAELRDIFVEATGSDTVTERQAEARGSLADDGDDDVERVRELVRRMRERYEFETDLDDDALVRLVREFYAEGTDGTDGTDGTNGVEDADEALAAALDVDAEAVFTARMDLHLVRPADRDAPVEYEALRRRVVDGERDVAIASALDADPAVVAHYRRVVETDLESTRANDRFRDGFEAVLTDSELTGRHARDAREDGLREATEDIETDVSL
jgi:hypothetical protein